MLLNMNANQLARGLLITRFPLKCGWGGEERLHLNLAEALKKQGVATSVWSSDPELCRRFAKDGHATKVASLYRDATAKWTLLLFPVHALHLLLAGRRFLRKRKEEGYSAIIMLTLLEKVVLTPLAHRLGFQVIWGHHAPLGNWFFRNPLLGLWRLWSTNAIIVTPSEAMKTELQTARPRGEIKVVSNPVTIPLATEPESQRFCERRGVSAEKVIIGTAGRIAREKNPHAFVQLAERFPEQLFLMAGDGPLQTDIEQIISSKRLQNAYLLGQLADTELAAFYRALDVFCVLSDYETFCLAAAEAMVSGTPVVAPNIGGLPEVVTTDKTGLLYPTKDFAAAAEALEKLIADAELRAKMSAAGFAERERFSSAQYVERMREVLFPM